LPEALIYRATDIAASQCLINPEPLDGTLETAQGYVDSITHSKWWDDHCTPSWLGDEFEPAVPKQIWVVHNPDEEMAYVEHRLFWWNDKRVPKLSLPDLRIYNDVKAIGDKWVILHELAHVWTTDESGWHGRSFCRAFLSLVHRWLGEEPSFVLKQAMKEVGIRLPYRLIPDL
jgi:hypothetical protein